MAITAEIVKKLRDKTNAGMMECKKALTESNGNLEEAETILRKKGILKAEGKASRAVKEGIVSSYIHAQGRVGVLIEVNCETDFVARTDVFRDMVKDICLHIAASSPTCLRREDVPEATITKERDIAAGQTEGHPQAAKIIQGKLDKYFSTVCLMEQNFIKDPDKTIADLVKGKITELGENIVIRRFSRYAVGEDIGDDPSPEA